MAHGQSRLIDWDHVAEVKEDSLANPRDGRLRLLVWEDKGMGPLFSNSINVMGYQHVHVRHMLCCCMQLERRG